MAPCAFRSTDIQGSHFEVGTFACPKGLFHQRSVLIPVMHDLGSCHRLRQVCLKHVAPIQPRRGLQGSFLHDHAERTPLRLRLEPWINVQACQLGLGLPKGDCDVRPGMVVQILGFLGYPPLHTPVLGVLPTSLRESRFSLAYSHPYEKNPLTWRLV